MSNDRQHLLSIGDLGREGIIGLLRATDACVGISERAIPMVPALRGKTVATLFFEASTRTRLSFETAAKRLSANTMTFSASNSSLEKGESLRDTIETIDAMGVDLMVIRHSGTGIPHRITQWTSASVVNAGDGAREHPTQALTDCFTIRSTRHHRFGITSDDLSGLRIAIVGDIRNSRVARSNVIAFTALGAEVVLVAPTTLLPPSLAGWPVTTSTSIDDVIGDVDVVYLLRLQSERTDEALLPSLGEYRTRFGLTSDRFAKLRSNALVMHPGPMNRGVEIDAEVADHANAIVTDQVKNGVAVRMAVLFSLLGTTGALNVPGSALDKANEMLVELGNREEVAAGG